MDLTDALAFARDRRQGVLATIRANGRPQLSNILFVPGEGDTLRSRSPTTGPRRANLRRDPRASLYVAGDTFWQYVVLEAVAELSPVAADPGDDTVEALVGLLPAPDRGSTRTGTSTGRPWCRTAGSLSRCAPNGPTGWSSGS